jgi:hypothetical protein
MKNLTGVLHNRDLINVLPQIADSLADYRNVPACVKVLAATTFVRDIEVWPHSTTPAFK